MAKGFAMTAKDGTNRGGARQGAGRPKGVTTVWTREQADRFRARIQTDMLIQRLSGLASGTLEMPPHAVTAALGLLRKVMPDQAAVEHSGEIATPSVIRAPGVADTAKDWADTHIPEQHTEH